MTLLGNLNSQNKEPKMANEKVNVKKKNCINKYLFSFVLSVLKDIKLYKVKMITAYLGFVAYLDVMCIPIIAQQGGRRYRVT